MNSYMLLDTSSSINKTKTTLNDILMRIFSICNCYFFEQITTLKQYRQLLAMFQPFLLQQCTEIVMPVFCSYFSISTGLKTGEFYLCVVCSGLKATMPCRMAALCFPWTCLLGRYQSSLLATVSESSIEHFACSFQKYPLN